MARVYPLVLVRWKDANSRGGWASEEQHDIRPSKCIQAGLLMPSEKDYVRLAFGVSEQGNVQASIAIPRKVVQDIQVLSKVELGE